MKFSKEVSKLRIDNSEKLTSQIQDVSDSVFNNTLIWVSSMIHSLVFSVWTSMSFLKDPEAELDWEEDANQESEPNTESQKMKPWNGSEENMMVPSITDSTYLYLSEKFKNISFFNLAIVLIFNSFNVWLKLSLKSKN